MIIYHSEVEMNKYKFYEKHDKKMAYYQEKLKIACRYNRYGVKYVSQCWEYLYEKGKTPSEIGEIFGITGASVYYRLRKMGVNIREPGGRNNVKLTKKDVLKIRSMFPIKNNSEIGRELGFSHTTIQKIRTGAAWSDVR